MGGERIAGLWTGAKYPYTAKSYHSMTFPAKPPRITVLFEGAAVVVPVVEDFISAFVGMGPILGLRKMIIQIGLCLYYCSSRLTN